MDLIAFVYTVLNSASLVRVPGYPIDKLVAEPNPTVAEYGEWVASNGSGQPQLISKTWYQSRGSVIVQYGDVPAGFAQPAWHAVVDTLGEKTPAIEVIVSQSVTIPTGSQARAFYKHNYKHWIYDLWKTPSAPIRLVGREGWENQVTDSGYTIAPL